MFTPHLFGALLGSTVSVWLGLGAVTTQQTEERALRAAVCAARGSAHGFACLSRHGRAARDSARHGSLPDNEVAASQQVRGILRAALSDRRYATHQLRDVHDRLHEQVRLVARQARAHHDDLLALVLQHINLFDRGATPKARRVAQHRRPMTAQPRPQSARRLWA